MGRLILCRCRPGLQTSPWPYSLSAVIPTAHTDGRNDTANSEYHIYTFTLCKLSSCFHVSNWKNIAIGTGLSNNKYGEVIVGNKNGLKKSWLLERDGWRTENERLDSHKNNQHGRRWNWKGWSLENSSVDWNPVLAFVSRAVLSKDTVRRDLCPRIWLH